MSRFALLSRRCLAGLAGILVSPALLAAGISATNQYARSENAGWLNFNATNGNVQVYPDHLEGYIWAENIGWIRLGSHSSGGAHTYTNNSNTTYGVNHDGNGRLSGYAWSENAGWINFQTSHSQVTIDANGVFDGYAWGENIGYIHFRNTSPAYQVAVQRDPQTITNFNPPATGVVSGSATLSATGGGSGNPVVFGATTPTICTVGGATVSYVLVGTCTVTANQTGNLLYLPAAQVTGNILIGLATLHDVAWSGNQFVVVGDSGVIRTSPDGASWTLRNSTSTNALNGVAWSGQTFVVVGDSGTILTSATGIVWTDHSPGGNPLYDVTWGGGRFVAVGHTGTILVSTDATGTAWNAQTVGTDPLNGVTWGGNQFVAAGDAGTILTSANGLAWSAVTPPTSENLLDIAWSGTQFVAVGTGGTILTSSDGTAWTAQTVGSAHLYGIAWTGRQFRVVGTAGAVLTSTDGSSWTSAPSGSVDWRGVTWSGDRSVMVGVDDTVLNPLSAWGEYSPLNPNFWGLVGLPANPTTSTIAGVFGDDDLGAYDTVWRVYQRNDVTYVDTFMADINSPLAQGVGYWIRHKNAVVKNLGLANAQATATPLVTTNPRCPSKVGCYEITLKSFSDRVRHNQISFPLPYPVVWGDVRIEVNDGVNPPIAYVPSAAQTYVNNQYWVWKNTANTNNYATFDDITPGKIGVLQPWQGIQVEVKPASFGKTVKLLIPALPKTSQALPPNDPVARHDRSPPPSRWSRLLDGLIAPATAAEPDEESAQTLGRRGREAIGEREREARREAHGQDLQAGRAWSVRLRVEETGPDPGNADLVFGQLADAQVGYDRYDLLDLPPEQDPPDLAADNSAPSLGVVFPHPDWGARAGDYASDYRPTNRGLPAASWRLEIRTDEPGRAVRLRLEGPSAILSRSTLLDEDTGARYPASDPRFLQEEGVPVTLHRAVSHFTWRYTSQPNR